MRTTLLLFSFFFLTLFSIGCADPLPLEEVSEDQKLMLWCEAKIGGEITARLQRTTPLDRSVEGGIDTTATISIRYTDGIDQVINLNWEPSRQLYTAGEFARLKVNERSTITVDVQDNAELAIEATMVHPRGRRLDSISVDSELQVRNDQHAVSVSLHVPSQQSSSIGEYYHIIPKRRVGYLTQQGVELGGVETMEVDDVWNNNLVVQPLSNQPGVLVDAERLEGEPIQLELISMDLDGNEMTTGLEFEVRSVTKDYFYYHSARSRMLVDHTDPHQTPVVITGNVKNGYGLYSSYVTTTSTIEL